MINDIENVNKRFDARYGGGRGSCWSGGGGSVRGYNSLLQYCRAVEARDGGGRLWLTLCWLRSAVEVARYRLLTGRRVRTRNRTSKRRFYYG